MINNNKAKLLTLIPIIFFSVSGGPYGLEEIVSSVGPSITLLLILLIPIIWTIPECLIVAELSSNYPIQGGYYRWVQMTMGRFWGFMEGYWSILYTILDLSLYPILFTTYLKVLFPELSHLNLYIIQLTVIWFSVMINIFGIKFVGYSLSVFKIFILIAFLFLIYFGFSYIKPSSFEYLTNFQIVDSKNLIYGLSLAFWNFIGWDNATPVLEEIEDSKTTYHKALFFTIPIIVFFYFFPILVGISIHESWQDWKFGEFSLIAETIHHNFLGIILTIGGMFMSIGIFNSLLLSSTRVFAAMSEDKLMPAFFSKKHQKYNTPYLSIIFTGVIYSVLVLFEFENLIVYDVFFYLIAMMLEIFALYILRKRNALTDNSFKIPGGKIGLFVVLGCAVLIILSMAIFTLSALFSEPLKLVFILVLFFGGMPLYHFFLSRS